ncbi:MAG TPA: OmpA family protein [Flavobacterium sp.]|jgi:OOP family OmpA-OmpF porin|nr:OmpA family protein [Flavobacterium sp.]
MKKSLLLLSFLALTFVDANAQDDGTANQEEKVMDSPLDSYNRWSVEVNVGQSKGIKPYAQGYYYSDPTRTFNLEVNHYSAGVRYMISPRFGLKFDAAYDNFSNLPGSGSLPFDMDQYRLGLQGVVNAVRLLGFEERAGRFGLLFHGGGQVTQMTPQVGVNADRTEYNGGLIFGVTPQLRITKRIGFHADITILSNVRQHFNWDGSYSAPENNLAGSMYTFAAGLSYSFGNQDIHGDWAIIADERSAELDELDKRIGEIETMMNDADKDGVPDYLDVENNSVAGVAVDSKGRMVDKNNNGVPDELENYVNSTVQESIKSAGDNSDVIKRLINEGYIAVFFDFGSSKPTLSSTENIAFILNYLRANPSASADITGYADEIGNEASNTSLSGQRANNVRNTLIQAGISAGRLNIVPAGEDKSVNPDSSSARRLVRKVTFMIK